jgi:hypothetical protein
MKKIIPAFVISCIFTACSPSVQYIGRSYAPTANVDLYFDTHDIKKDYEVMGKIDGIGGIIESGFQDIQNKIVEEAKKRGADGVIIYNMEQRVVGTTTNTSTTVSNHRQWFNRTNIFSSTSSSNVTQNVLHADLIKYTSGSN